MPKGAMCKHRVEDQKCAPQSHTKGREEGTRGQERKENAKQKKNEKAGKNVRVCPPKDIATCACRN